MEYDLRWNFFWSIFVPFVFQAIQNLNISNVPVIQTGKYFLKMKEWVEMNLNNRFELDNVIMIIGVKPREEEKTAFSEWEWID